MGVVPVTLRPKFLQREARGIWISALLFLLTALLLPWAGPDALDWHRVLHREAPDWEILVQLRITRTWLALLAGGAVSLCGSVFQAMLRDGLATPYTLGISAGAALGAVLVIATGLTTLFGFPAVWLGALAGAAVVLTLALGGTLAGRWSLSANTLLLTGIGLNSVCGAGILILNGFAGVSRGFSISRWLIGSVDSTSYASLSGLAVVVIGLGWVLLTQARGWNLLAVGEQWAATRGARPRRLMLVGYCGGSLLIAGVIALCGPIAFVDLLVPHLVRRRISADHRILLPCSFLLGGVLLALCDTAGRIIMPPAELPAGAILALLGGPYLVWAVRERTRVVTR